MKCFWCKNYMRINATIPDDDISKIEFIFCSKSNNKQFNDQFVAIEINECTGYEDKKWNN